MRQDQFSNKRAPFRSVNRISRERPLERNPTSECSLGPFAQSYPFLPKVPESAAYSQQTCNMDEKLLTFDEAYVADPYIETKKQTNQRGKSVKEITPRYHGYATRKFQEKNPSQTCR